MGPAEGTEVVTFTSDSREGGSGPMAIDRFQGEGPPRPTEEVTSGARLRNFRELGTRSATGTRGGRWVTRGRCSGV